MADADVQSKSFWVQTAQTLGISTVVMCFLGYWAIQTIQWERDQMLPAIQGSKVAIEHNTEVVKDNSEVMKSVTEMQQDLKETLDRLDKTTKTHMRESKE